MYKIITVVTLLPLFIGTFIGSSLGLVLFKTDLSENLSAKIVLVLTASTFLLGGWIASFFFIRKRVLFAKNIVAQARKVAFLILPKALICQENLDLLKDLATYNIVRDILVSLNSVISSDTLMNSKTYTSTQVSIPTEYFKRYKRLEQIKVTLQAEAVNLVWHGESKKVAGKAWGLNCTCQWQKNTEATINLIVHEISHVLLDYVFKIYGDVEQHRIINLMQHKYPPSFMVFLKLFPRT